MAKYESGILGCSKINEAIVGKKSVRSAET